MGLKIKTIFLILSLCSTLSAASSLDTLYNSLDPLSISELFAFYQLYPETKQGKKALESAWNLLNKHRPFHEQLVDHLRLPFLDIQSIISIVNRQAHQTQAQLDETQLKFIEKISDHLSNRHLKGFNVWKIHDLYALKNEEIDLARALFLFEFSEDILKVRQYEANIDLMALQILARLPKGATNYEKIAAINAFIFHEMRFRFPPHSLWPKNVDTYTLLPSILDNRLGVCLGVSILYLSLAQRLDLPLEIITPPGHIYVRYREENKTLNIETTARGIHLPSEHYLGMNTRKLQMRTIKEVIGLSFMNQAALAWQQKDYALAIKFYEKGQPFLPDDYLIKMFLGLNYLCHLEKEKGEKLLREVYTVLPDENVMKDTMIEDYFKGNTDVEGLKTLFLNVDETRSSILEKQKELKKVLEKYPKFRDGIFHLGITFLQLGRGKEALDTFQRYHEIDEKNPTVEYFLANLCLERQHFSKAWDHIQKAEEILLQRDHKPKCLKDLIHELRIHLRKEQL